MEAIRAIAMLICLSLMSTGCRHDHSYEEESSKRDNHINLLKKILTNIAIKNNSLFRLVAIVPVDTAPLLVLHFNVNLFLIENYSNNPHR
ncbi:hypothetical protein SAMN06297358_0699 [Pedobacter xixiisoli]|uniref:Uncharacterized protein n=1 Tax=Pedobacter xixiisoli TaxID=1476464 RepID=A0A285ZS85_9SPHI|nr:hypothetical protein SAMN06297358_0699 [Pedobacter xixiisoli]